MSDPFIADTQYGDLKGTAAFDSHNSPPLHRLAELTDMPEGYFPVGFQLFRFDAEDDGKIPFSVVAVRSDEAGKTLDEWVEFERETGEIPVYSFSGNLEPKHFPALFKRIDIKVTHKCMEKLNIRVHPLP